MSIDPRLVERALELCERHQGMPRRGGRPPAWLEARLARGLEAMAQSAGQSPQELVGELEQQHERRAELAELLRVGETRFFRDPPQWHALRAKLLPSFRGNRLRALSAGCSTGEEAWTLAMLLDEAAGGRPIRVVGLDRSTAALSAAREGVYSKESLRDLPADLAERYLSPEEGGSVRVVASLRDRVSFAARDLLDGVGPGEFDVVLCKNVLIYLGEQAGERALAALEYALGSAGALFVARSEIPRARSFGLVAEELAPGVVVFRARGHAPSA